MTGKRVLTTRENALPALAEAFREYGFEGASLAVLSKATGLGKGSLYNFFPGGKEEMMEAVLAEIDRWFADTIFASLVQAEDPAAAVTAMFDEVTAYFRSGRRVCLVGALSLNVGGGAFAATINGYFSRWIAALARCLEVANVPPASAAVLAEEAVSGIQGAIVLARALGEHGTFNRIVDRQRASLLAAIRDGATP